MHRGRIFGESCECFSNKFVGPDFAIRPLLVCLHPCPFANKPNRIDSPKPASNGHETSQRHVTGVGTELHNLLSKLGFHPTDNCECARHIAEMDKNGAEWCSKNLERIVGWLRHEAKKRHIPFAAPMARLLIRKAIRNTSKQLVTTT